MKNISQNTLYPASAGISRTDDAAKREEQRLWDLEAQWQRKMAAMRATPRSETPEAPEETTIEEDVAELEKAFRHNMTTEDWKAFRGLVHRQKVAKWQAFIGNVMDDYDYIEIFILLQFKIDRMVEYWRQFSHLANGDRISSQMGLASRLLQIIIKNGNENPDIETLPQYVNLRNKARFEVRNCGESFYLGERQHVRFCKAYCLFFKLLQENILTWWD